VLSVIERWSRCGFREGRPALVINPEIERIVRRHPDHDSAAEHAGLAEHAAHSQRAERRELLAQKIDEAVARNHSRQIAPLDIDHKREIWTDL
jgi:hypothetical protein